MPHAEEFSNTVLVKVNGTQLPADVDSLLIEVSVEDSLLLPGHFTLRFNDEGGVVLQKGGFKIGAEVEINVQATTPGGPEKLLTGEITALEVEGREGALHTVVRGLDLAHRMQRGARTRVFLNMSASDIAQQVAGEWSLTAEVDSTSTVAEHTAQSRESDWDFLQRLAAETHRLCLVTEKKLRFVKPPTASEGPSTTDARSEPLVLEHGVNLVDVRATLTSAQQVDEVHVRGWDPKQKREIVAKRPVSASSATNAETGDAKAKPPKLATSFPTAVKSYVEATAARHVQTAVDERADSLLAHLAGGFAELDGTARGSVALRAGAAVRMAGLGDAFDGRHLLTATRHTYTPESGYRTTFIASNTSERSLFGSTSPAPAPHQSMCGLVPAIVTDANDPDKLGRVKVKMPWLADDFQSDWARVANPGGGKERGMAVLPEVDDEVLVGFAHGDLGHPYVIGGLYNGVDKPRSGAQVVGGNGMIERRAWVSRTGMVVAFEEKQGTEQVVVSSVDEKQKITLKQKPQGGIEILTDGPVAIDAKQNVTVATTTGNVEVTTQSGNMDLKAVNVNIEAQGNLTLKGTNAKVEGTAMAELSGGATTTVKGGIVRIN